MKKEISDMVTNPISVFNLFKENIYIPGEEEQLGKMIKTMEMISKNDINDKDSISSLREEISQVNSFNSLWPFSKFYFQTCRTIPFMDIFNF